MEVAVVKYNAGNVFSVINALSRLGVKAVLTDDAEVIQNASHVVFPGQGEAAGAMKCLRDTGLDKVILGLRQPVLGICIGQQLMCRHSEEGDVDCLGIFDTDVKRFVVNPDDTWDGILSLISADLWTSDIAKSGCILYTAIMSLCRNGQWVLRLIVT